MQGEFVRGWRVLTASFLGIGVSMVSLLYYSAGVFIKPLEEEFGWTRAELGFSGLLSVVTLSVVAPFVGKAIDRYSLRKISTLSLVLYACGIFALAQMNGALWVYYLIIVCYTIVGVGSSPIAFTRAVTAWFVQNRGLALGLSLTSTGIAGVILPTFMTPWVAEHGWRSGYQVLGIVALMVTPIVWYWIRDLPPDDDGVEDPGPVLAGVDVRAALTDRTFWILGAIFLFVALAVSGLIVSFIPLLLDIGMSPKDAGSYGALLGAAVMCGRLFTGFAIDRIFAPWVAALTFCMVGIGCLIFLLGGAQMAFATAMALGFAMGAEVDLLGYFTARYFGMRNYATLYGCLYSVFALGAGISPMIAGRIYDVTRSYDNALLGAVGLLAVSSVLCLSLRRFPVFNLEQERIQPLPGPGAAQLNPDAH